MPFGSPSGLTNTGSCGATSWAGRGMGSSRSGRKNAGSTAISRSEWSRRSHRPLALRPTRRRSLHTDLQAQRWLLDIGLHRLLMKAFRFAFGCLLLSCRRTRKLGCSALGVALGLLCVPHCSSVSLVRNG